MPGPVPGIVGQQNIAGLQGINRVFLQEKADTRGHCIDVARRTGHRLRQHPPPGIEDAGGKVTRFAHGGGKCRSDQNLRLFFHHGQQAVPENL